MNPMQSILVHIDASPRAAVRLEIARQLARRHDARMLCALFAIEPTSVPAAVSAAPEVPPLLLAEIDPGQRARARALFDATLASGEPSMTWDEIPGDPPTDGFSEAAMYADLMVLGQKDPDDPHTFDVPSDFVDEVLLRTGRPGLVIPHAGRFETVDTLALVAWKPTRECARAVTCAIPLLQQAKRVRVVSWGDDSPAKAETPFSIGRYLKWHGIDAEVRRHDEDPDDVGNLLLSRASDEGADLLVMGCYSHGRIREAVLGGATRVVLKSMTCPVLMAH